MAKEKNYSVVGYKKAELRFAVVVGEGIDPFEDGGDKLYKVAMKVDKDTIKQIDKDLESVWAKYKPSGSGELPTKAKDWVKDYNGVDVIWVEQTVEFGLAVEQEDHLDLGMEDIESIGAGTIAEVRVRFRPYSYKGKYGVSRYLEGIIVDEFVKYEKTEKSLGKKKIGGVAKKKDKKKKKKKDK